MAAGGSVVPPELSGAWAPLPVLARRRRVWPVVKEVSECGRSGGRGGSSGPVGEEVSAAWAWRRERDGQPVGQKAVTAPIMSGTGRPAARHHAAGLALDECPLPGSVQERRRRGQRGLQPADMVTGARLICTCSAIRCSGRSLWICSSQPHSLWSYRGSRTRPRPQSHGSSPRSHETDRLRRSRRSWPAW